MVAMYKGVYHTAIDMIPRLKSTQLLPLSRWSPLLLPSLTKDMVVISFGGGGM